MFVKVTNQIDQKQITVAENKLSTSKKYIPRSNSLHLPVARNISA